MQVQMLAGFAVTGVLAWDATALLVSMRPLVCMSAVQLTRKAVSAV